MDNVCDWCGEPGPVGPYIPERVDYVIDDDTPLICRNCDS